MKKISLLVIFNLTCLSIFAQSIATEVLIHAHSHNDYQHPIPLWDALEQGCASIEIDVFAHKGALKVAHINVGLNFKKNLSESYLQDLQKILEDKGHIYPNHSLVLMIDFKSNAEYSLQLLREVIAPIKSYCTYYHNGRIYEGPIQFVISGSGIQYPEIAATDSIYFFKDGSVHNCEENIPASLVPRGSASYGSQFKWKGKKEMPENELNKLRAMIAEAQKCNKKLRFYAMPAKEKIWRTFLDEGVYWINIDNPKKFKRFYQNYNQ